MHSEKGSMIPCVSMALVIVKLMGQKIKSVMVDIIASLKRDN